jgi:hypothetical protein
LTGGEHPGPELLPDWLRARNRDNQVIIQFRCPECRQWADIDDDQLHGRVSIDHTGTGCGFHETHDLATVARLPADWIWQP